MSFASGLAQSLADGMTSKGDFIRERVEEERTYLRQQGLQRQAAVAQQRTAYETAAQSLIRRGASRELVLGQLEQDPQGLMEVYHASDNVTNGAAIDSVFNLNEEYSGASLSEIIGKVLPTASTIPADTPAPQVQQRTLASFLGLDMDEALNDQVYRSQIVGGMTGDDILATVGQPVRATGTGSTTLNLEGLEGEKPVSSQEITRAHTRLSIEYSAELREKIDSNEEKMALLDPKSEDYLTIWDENRRLKSILETTNVSERLGLLMTELGVSASAQEIFDSRPGIFKEVLPPNILDLFVPQEEVVEEGSSADVTSKRPLARPEVTPDLTEEIEEAATKAFEDNPDLEEATITVQGHEFIVPNLEMREAEKEVGRSTIDPDVLAARPDIPRPTLGAPRSALVGEMAVGEHIKGELEELSSGSGSNLISDINSWADRNIKDPVTALVGSINSWADRNIKELGEETVHSINAWADRAIKEPVEEGFHSINAWAEANIKNPVSRQLFLINAWAEDNIKNAEELDGFKNWFNTRVQWQTFVSDTVGEETITASEWDGVIGKLQEHGYSLEEAEEILLDAGYSKEDS